MNRGEDKLSCPECGYVNGPDSGSCEICGHIIEGGAGVVAGEQESESDVGFKEVQERITRIASGGFLLIAAGILLFYVPYIMYLGYALIFLGFALFIVSGYPLGKERVNLSKFLLVAFGIGVVSELLVSYTMSTTSLSGPGSSNLVSAVTSWFGTTYTDLLIEGTIISCLFAAIFSIVAYRIVPKTGKRAVLVSYTTFVGIAVYAAIRLMSYSSSLETGVISGSLGGMSAVSRLIATQVTMGYWLMLPLAAISIAIAYGVLSEGLVRSEW